MAANRSLRSGDHIAAMAAPTSHLPQAGISQTHPPDRLFDPRHPLTSTALEVAR